MSGNKRGLRARFAVPATGPTSLPIPLRGDHPAPADAPPSLTGPGAAADAGDAHVSTEAEGSEAYGAEPGTIAAPGEPRSSSSTSRDASARGPETQTIVHLVRHGEVHNPDGVLYGRLPGFRLSELGRSQAETVGRVLGSGHDIVSIVASPLQRAQETAAPLAERLGLPVGIDEDIIEADNRFEGNKVGGRGGALRDPQYWPILLNPMQPSWGEPYLQIAHRMIGAVYSALDVARGHEAVLVSHQLPVYTTRRFLEGRRLWHDPRKRQCSLASITSLVFEGTTLRDIVYSEPAGASDPSQTGA
ncbi:histidine phosphatase family protein [Dietzia sp. NPDC055877]|uniref:histidine phosphatase family protein n=1 Tax=Dietzia aurantiaca TaxID=983873 RepID=UPI003FD89C7A